MTPQQAAVALRRKAEAFRSGAIHAERVTVQETLDAADRQSAGQYSQSDLNRAGNPFARRAPNSAFDPAIVNKGKGVFRRSWKSEGPNVTGGQVVSKVWNTDPNAKRLLGSSKMIPRPVRDAIIAQVQPGRIKRLRAVIRQAVGG